MAPTAKAADKKKSKKTSRSGAETTSRSKEKGDRKSKDKDRKASSKKEKATTPAEPVAATTPTPAPPLVHDPDAIQLFRRYDRNRSGVLTRLDFLQLLRDYGDPGSSGWGATLSRPPLSLTDTSGIPLGYQRADRNSEFEAGQLFERYDKDHSGALTVDTFHVFFADFKLQLRAFVEESNYRAVAPPAPAVSVTPAPLHPVKEEDEPVPTPVTASVRDTASSSDDVAPSPKALRAKYRATLWRLRKICKDELFDQRENIVQRMKLIRDGMATRQRHTSRSSGDTRWGDSRRGKQRPITVSFPDFDDGKTIIADEDGAIAEKGEAQQYESMEDDLDKLDELIRYVRRYLNKGNEVTRREMQEFIEQADAIEEDAQCLAMKDYSSSERQSRLQKNKENDPPPAPTSGSAPVLPFSLPSAQTQNQKQKDLEGLLRVKDQMIYQLLQERTAMRKERAAVEASLKKLSGVSTREMKKWARLTDDMQAEIEQLRSQLRLQS